MKSLVSGWFLQAVFAAVFIFCASSRAYGQNGPCLVDTGTNLIFTCSEYAQFDTFLAFYNYSNATIVVSEPFNVLSGDSDIFSIEWPVLPFAIPSGSDYDLPIHIGFQCPPTKDVYSETLGIYSGSTLCAIDTLTLHVLFPVTDTIDLNIPPGNSNPISLVPLSAISRHVIKVTDSTSNGIFLDSLKIVDPYGIVYFGAEGNETFKFGDSLLAGQSNDAAILTSHPSNTGTYDIRLLQYYNGNPVPQSYPMQVSVLSFALGAAQLLFEFQSYKNLIPGDTMCQGVYVQNETPDTVEISQIFLNDDPRPGVQWLLEDTTKLHTKLDPGTVLAITLCALLPPGDTAPLTGSLNIVQQTLCGQTDTGVLPLDGEPSSQAASVSDYLLQPTGFTLTPNPASGEVTISLPPNENSTIEIYDVLGNLLLSRQASGEYVWNPETPGGYAANGTYIVRVTERGTDGRNNVSSQRLLFIR